MQLYQQRLLLRRYTLPEEPIIVIFMGLWRIEGRQAFDCETFKEYNTADQDYSTMLLLNFSHPITPAQAAQIEAQTGQSIARTIDLPTQFNEQQPFAPQLAVLLAAIDLTPAQWQGEPILVMLPSLNFIAGMLLAELHGRMGYFPPVVRTRPVANTLPRRYEVAEILDLQFVREQARKLR